MIVDPTTDEQCLGQLTRMARELAPTTLIRDAAANLGSPRVVVAWLQSLPQTDDDGHEHIRAIACDVWQRTRLLPDDPNCVERSFAALTLLEVLDPATPRMLVTIERPLRHTGVVERRGTRWQAIDLFPRRNASIDWDRLGLAALKGAHQYVGKPVLKFYLGDTGGKIADAIGDQESRLGPQAPAKKEAQPARQPVVAAVTRAGIIDTPTVVAATTAGANGGGADGKATERAPAADGTARVSLGGDRGVPSTEAQRWGWG